MHRAKAASRQLARPLDAKAEQGKGSSLAYDRNDPDDAKLVPAGRHGAVAAGGPRRPDAWRTKAAKKPERFLTYARLLGHSKDLLGGLELARGQM